MVSRMTLWKFESDHQDSSVDGEDRGIPLVVGQERLDSEHQTEDAGSDRASCC